MWLGTVVAGGQQRGRSGKPAGGGVERVEPHVGGAAVGQAGGEVRVGGVKGGGGRQRRAEWEEAGSGQLCSGHGSQAEDWPGAGPGR